MRGRSAALVLCVIAELTGCRGGPPADHDAGPAGEPSLRSSSKPSTKTGPPAPSAVAYTRSPLSQAELPTTSGEIALSNLNGQIRGQEQMLAASPKDPERAAGLVDLLLTRGDF